MYWQTKTAFCPGAPHDVTRYFFPPLDRLLSTPLTDGLIGLSLRWMQPIQQHGRRFPSLSFETILRTCCRLVSGALTEIVQQIHSFRASGVISSHAARAFASETRAFRKSEGRPCAVPAEIFLFMRLF